MTSANLSSVALSNCFYGGIYHAISAGAATVYKSKALAAAIPSAGASFIIGGLSCMLATITYPIIREGFDRIDEGSTTKERMSGVALIVASLAVSFFITAGFAELLVGGGFINSCIYAGYQLAIPFTLILGAATHALYRKPVNC